MINEQIYTKLSRIIPDMESRLANGIGYGKSKVNGYMDLNFDYLGLRRDGKHTIALSHNYKLNGDMVPDPDMQIRIDTSAKTAEAMTFQNLYLFQEVSFDEVQTDPKNEKLKKELNLFLSQWLTNAIEQGHRIDFSESERERTAENQQDVEELRDDELSDLRNKKSEKPEQGIER